jgi:hypothetical protein
MIYWPLQRCGSVVATRAAADPREIQRYDFHGVFEGLMRAWTGGWGNSAGVKSPLTMRFGGATIAGFPHMQILHIVRWSGRGLVLAESTLRTQTHLSPGTRVGPIHTVMASGMPIRSATDDTFMSCATKTGDRPERTLAGICQFLGEEYSANMLSFFKARIL